ncbi:hypothetical protein E8E13_002038 [Curvularia kusanoi]|uniref:Heterokaryon incompatibility domain-containing protein n=1 Tax=Curvularia kusanoi TaxID=90978 RepID=A0A9P4TAF9_CURKU|nr:hypothetical protein E8E13_002038 [Curvularia kusanoi]
MASTLPSKAPIPKSTSALSTWRISHRALRLQIFAYMSRRKQLLGEESYKPLEAEQICLLYIMPGNFDDDLEFYSEICELDEVDFSYNALSYVWGDDSAPKEAFMDGKKVSVGASLDDAVRHVRASVTDGMWIWIDALSINQEDNDERNHQVALMAKIYSLAREVLIWLGPRCPENECILEMKSILWDFRRPRSFSCWSEDRKRLAKLFAWICYQPWFGRIWILQEFTLARQDPVFYIGSKRIPWEVLRSYLDSLWDRARDGYNVDSWPGTLRYNEHPVRAGRLRQVRDLYGPDAKWSDFSDYGLTKYIIV